MASKTPYSDLLRRRSQWKKRLYAEWKYNPGSTFFVTLTYEDSHVPVEFDDQGIPLHYTTSKRDVQLFWKRVRKNYGDDVGALRYFIVSEFGDDLGRPHYHALIFTENKVTVDFMRSIILDCWHKGYIIDVQYLKGRGGIGYVVDYIQKNTSSSGTFALMSRRPGIGYKYIEKHKSFHTPCCDVDPFDLTPAEYREFAKMLESRKYFRIGVFTSRTGEIVKPSLPRFFSEKLYSHRERKEILDFQLNELTQSIKQMSYIEYNEYLESERNYFEDRERIARKKVTSRTHKHPGRRSSCDRPRGFPSVLQCLHVCSTTETSDH
ncbi:replication initiator protein [Dipodfec virus UOA04_Rod_1017]|nr:replication initiator protein [Dipodfec virus UOA04_Rod_1017]